MCRSHERTWFVRLSSDACRSGKIEIAIQDEDASKIADIIQQKASTGSEGDGIIFISPIEEAVRIKDGTRGPEVLL
ncbi:P-II family nitrogen regulator [Gracilimonas sp.]|uniref:P-II family nitrogen regulator n=1 Tax=Gracilimonas sp. TaxID=1974203 RepID=UPI00375087E3